MRWSYCSHTQRFEQRSGEPISFFSASPIETGQGTAAGSRTGSFFGSVTTLRPEALTKRQVASTSSLLQGLAPGVSVQQQSGKPGADASSIRIRGISSIYAGSSPLVMVDGVVSSLESLDPNAIESITILKDAASTAIYGTRAANTRGDEPA